MGVRGGTAPTGATQRIAKTIFLRAPYADWAALAQGYKTEFRAGPLGAASIYAPTPVVLYAVSSGGHRREKLMVLVEHRRERLIDADRPEALMREGFPTYNEFRMYWRRRSHRPFLPLEEVSVFRLAPWTLAWREKLGAVLLERLYGAYL